MSDKPCQVYYDRKNGLFYVIGDDLTNRIYPGMPCIVCRLPVQPGEGSQAQILKDATKLPALHSQCLQFIKSKEPS